MSEAFASELPSPAAANNSGPPTNGLELRVWPQLVDGLTWEVGNFTIQIADPACDQEDNCAGIEDEASNVLLLLHHTGRHIRTEPRFC